MSDETADKMGVPRGTTIPWREGIPDFGAHVVPGPGGMRGTFNVPGMIGETAVDKKLMIDQMAAQTGMSKNQVKKWLAANDVDLHHAGGTSVQIVPKDIHALHHSGGAHDIRTQRK